jgi:hypothetical protein
MKVSAHKSANNVAYKVNMRNFHSNLARGKTLSLWGELASNKLDIEASNNGRRRERDRTPPRQQQQQHQQQLQHQQPQQQKDTFCFQFCEGGVCRAGGTAVSRGSCKFAIHKKEADMNAAEKADFGARKAEIEAARAKKRQHLR